MNFFPVKSNLRMYSNRLHLSERIHIVQSDKIGFVRRGQFKFNGMIGLILITLAFPLQAKVLTPHGTVTVREYERVFTTYPYSDPDPVPAMSRIYPYFRYDGYTDKPIKKKWKIVELSNKYIKVLITPQIGGKIWTAIEKSTGRPFIYFNGVVKFRDISERGPWTSGGIEPNYGIFGHTPDCFSPVDYRIEKHADGSVSCIIGALDLLTRSTWRIDIRLRPGVAYFTTHSIWQNGSGMEEPYYSWMNAAEKASGNLQFIYPGTNWIFHTGTVHPWPIDTANGHNISWYDQNDFGGAKSYHVLGKFTRFYGAYWHDYNFGMAHYASYGHKLGKKIWIWGLSGQGMIWKKLLTDKSGQYVEMQSGRLFNQAMPQSTYTPFKHKGFAPYGTDTWTEYWMPVKGIGGFVTASPLGAMNVTRNGKEVVVGISPVRPYHGTLRLFDRDSLLYSREVSLKTMQPVEDTVRLREVPGQLRVTVGGDKLEYASGNGDDLTRPLFSPKNFDWNSTYGLYVLGKECVRRRQYAEADSDFQKCLLKNAYFAPALDQMASLENRRADYQSAYDYARTALSIDTYDPEANYQFGLASVGLGHEADAKAAFSIAALTQGWRSAACTALAKEYMREKKCDRVLANAKESLNYDRFNLDALRLEVCADRLTGDGAAANSVLKFMEKIDPLSHFAQFEEYLMGKASAGQFTGMIRSDLAYQTYLELAAWYHDIGLNGDAVKVLELAPRQAEVLYWLAYLKHDTKLLTQANAASPDFVFPFRIESLGVFEWAEKHSTTWQPKYYLALLRWFEGDIKRAGELLASCGNKPRFAPFYGARAQVISAEAIPDLQRAATLDPGQWRYGYMMAQLYLAQGNYAAADKIAGEYGSRFPGNSSLIKLQAQTLISTGRYDSAVKLLLSSNLLPAEGVKKAHTLYREAYLMEAVRSMKAGSYRDALKEIELARKWPENLGVGMPYPKDIDDRMENWLSLQCYRHLGMKEDAGRTLEVLALQLWPETGNLTVSKPRSFEGNTSGGLIHALALKEDGRDAEAREVLHAWMKEDTSSAMANWGEKVFNGERVSLPISVQDAGCQVLDAWLNERK